ncbi:carbohydrate kinase [Paenibacillus sp. CAA11]|uniref:carbohydrate kinase family protein n=1 Tax=Paenibacillus sp. CAA11 TaxID=1532905 RepID=UPI000D362D01|nr:carbohydrate kinase [Paenibacillus sp. CAA11]AWB45915.1 carbohydrate kinase [Paenibacillus sp. CAA11]
MAEQKTVICIGELLIDFFCMDIGAGLAKGEHFSKQAGGAPANVSAAISRLGGQSAFAGKVGADPFGDFLKKTLDDQQVDTSMLRMDASAPTTMAFVSLQADGERDFVFNRGADRNMTAEDIDPKQLQQAGIIHFGSATALLENPFRKAYFDIMQDASRMQKFVSFDPNFRTDLWRGREEEFIALARQGISQADLVKLSEEELKLITGQAERASAVQLLHQWGAGMAAVTLGAEGTFVSNGTEAALVPSIPVKSIDSTGAGDAFVGAMLLKISRLEDPKALVNEFERLNEFTSFANKVGALVCMKVGAIASLPTWDEVERF